MNQYNGKHIKNGQRTTKEMPTSLLGLLLTGASYLTVCLWNVLISINSTQNFEKYIVAACATAPMTVLLINLLFTVIEILAAQYPSKNNELSNYNKSFEITVKYLGFGAFQFLLNVFLFFILEDYLSPIPLLCGAGIAFTAVSLPWAFTKRSSVNQRLVYRLFITEAIVFIMIAVPIN